MDGRNRLEAIKREGHTSPLEVNTRGVRYHYAIKRERKRWVVDCDPVKFILSKNVYRRHLTPEQKRAAIAAYIKADPTASNREVSRTLKVDKNTVASVRTEGDRRNSDRGGIGARPNLASSSRGRLADVGCHRAQYISNVH
jgi:hypothetical protein